MPARTYVCTYVRTSCLCMYVNKQDASWVPYASVTSPYGQLNKCARHKSQRHSYYHPRHHYHHHYSTSRSQCRNSQSLTQASAPPAPIIPEQCSARSKAAESVAALRHARCRFGTDRIGTREGGGGEETEKKKSHDSRFSL